MTKRLIILKDLPSERSVSMERYAEELSVMANHHSNLHSATISMPEAAADVVRTRFDKLKRYYRRYIEYPRFLRGQHADVYHIADHSYAHLIRALPQERTVVTCHDLMLLHVDEWNKARKWSPALPLFKMSVSNLKYAAKVVAVSDITRDELIRNGLADEAQITVIPPPVSPTFRRSKANEAAELRQNAGYRPEDLLVLHVGTPGRYKNLPTVLNVLAELRNRGLPAFLIRVGRELTGSEAQKMHDLGIEKWVREVGPVDDSILSNMYRMCDVLLFPSFKEGFGWPVVEAMASALPVIASDAASITQSLDGSGVQRSPSDVLGFADAVQELWADSGYRASLGEMGFQRSKAFSRETVGEALANLYAEVIG